MWERKRMMAPTSCLLTVTSEETKGILKGINFPCSQNVIKGKKGIVAVSFMEKAPEKLVSSSNVISWL